MVREAFRLAMEERPGAVHLELPEDIADEDCDESIFDVVGFRRPDADELAIQEVAKMIENAKMPLLLIGAGANRKRTCRALTDFIEQTAPHFLIYKWEKVLYMSVAEHIGQLKEEHVPMGLTKDHLIMIKLFS